MGIAVEEKLFRLDLFYRVAGSTFHVPPLRNRSEDIVGITDSFLGQLGLTCESEAKALLLSHPWPGNVRELLNVLKRSVVLANLGGSKSLLPEYIDLKSPIVPSILEQDQKICTIEAMEADLVKRVLVRTGWSRSQTAKELGIARSTLFEKMKKYGFRDRG